MEQYAGDGEVDVVVDELADKQLNDHIDKRTGEKQWTTEQIELLALSEKEQEQMLTLTIDKSDVDGRNNVGLVIMTDCR